MNSVTHRPDRAWSAVSHNGQQATRRVLLLAAVLFSGSLMADVTATEEHQFTLNDNARISIENVNGDIDIKAASGSEATLIVHKKADNQKDLDSLKVEIDSDENFLRVEVRRVDNDRGIFNWNRGGSGQVSFELAVPMNADLEDIETVNGEINIAGIRGPVNASTVNGELELTGLQNDAELETVNGSIDAQFDSLAGDQRVTASAVNGRITIRLPADADARVKADTLNGGIDVDDFNLDVEKGVVGKDVDGAIGSGSARLSIDTVNGSIKLRADG